MINDDELQKEVAKLIASEVDDFGSVYDEFLDLYEDTAIKIIELVRENTTFHMYK